MFFIAISYTCSYPMFCTCGADEGNIINYLWRQCHSGIWQPPDTDLIYYLLVASKSFLYNDGSLYDYSKLLPQATIVHHAPSCLLPRTQ